MRKLTDYKPTKFMAKDSRYDADAADYAVGFIECLCHFMCQYHLHTILSDYRHYWYAQENQPHRCKVQSD